jgi:hypothetical protein
MYVSEGFWQLLWHHPFAGMSRIPEDDEDWSDDLGFDSLLARFRALIRRTRLTTAQKTK